MENKFVPEHLTIAGLRRAYANGGLSPRDVASAIIDRAGESASYNVWIVAPDWDFVNPYLEALENMGDDERAQKPLWGIPFAVKDNIDLAGVPTTAGCPAYAYTPDRSATVVAKLIDAGAFPVGKTNLDQFATGLVGTRSPYGECNNAFDPALISGGSSSGSAVAVALGMAAFSLGTDTAGSGRVPAALNGLVGFKPPLGSWSTTGVVPACASLDCVTVFARTLDDCETVDAVASGPDETCAWSRKFDCPSVDTFPRTVYVPCDEPRFYGDFAEEYRAAWHRALVRLEDAARANGARFERVDTQWLSDIASILYDGAWVAERWSDLGAFVAEHADDVFPVTRTILESGNRPDLSAADAFAAYHTVFAARARARALLFDAVLVMPTAGGTFTRDEVRADPIRTNSLMGLYTNHCNLCDLVAVDVPAGEASAKHPFGITFFSSSASQGGLLSAARAFSESNEVTVAVCGQHMRDFALHPQLEDLGAEFLGKATTAPVYRLFALPTDPVKPGLLRGAQAETGIDVELYRMSVASFGALVSSVPAPLGFGSVELEDGSCANGFLVEACAVVDDKGAVVPGVREITQLGSFTTFMDAGC